MWYESDVAEETSTGGGSSQAMKIAICVLVILIASVGVMWSVVKLMQAIDEAFEAAARKDYNKICDRLTLFRVFGWE